MVKRAAIVVALVVCGATLRASDWPAVVRPLEKQVPRLEMMGPEDKAPGICSGAVINVKAGYVVTAAHCVEGEHLAITVNGRHAEVARANRLLDLAVVRFEAKGEVEIELAGCAPDIGAEIAVAGYAFGIEKLAVQFGRVSQTLNGETKAMWLNVDLIFGDSGGPAVDERGRLVGINSRIYSRGPAHLAAVVPLEAVRDFLAPYLPAGVRSGCVKPEPVK
jgi:S1-C subfamily serine protease